MPISRQTGSFSTLEHNQAGLAAKPRGRAGARCGFGSRGREGALVPRPQAALPGAGTGRICQATNPTASTMPIRCG